MRKASRSGQKHFVWEPLGLSKNIYFSRRGPATAGVATGAGRCSCSRPRPCPSVWLSAFVPFSPHALRRPLASPMWRFLVASSRVFLFFRVLVFALASRWLAASAYRPGASLPCPFPSRPFLTPFRLLVAYCFCAYLLLLVCGLRVASSLFFVGFRFLLFFSVVR